MDEAPCNLNPDGTFLCDSCNTTYNASAPFVMICFGPAASELRCGDPVAKRGGLVGNVDCIGDDYYNDEASE